VSPRISTSATAARRRTSLASHRLSPRSAPTLRGAPPELPFVLDVQSLRSGLNFTLSTTAGDLDLLGEVPGVGTFADVSKDAVEVELLGSRVHIMSLDALERSKRAAGRAKDLLDLAEIRELRKQRG
jgi:hypothetical protein